MKFSTSVSAAIAMALAAQVSAAPAAVSELSLSVRDVQRGEVLIARMNDHTAKRELMTTEEMEKRDYAIVTEILSYINSTGLAPGIIAGLVEDPTLGPIVTNAVVAIVKLGAVDLTTLLTALNQSGLAAQVIQDLISDCQFYAEIYKIALLYISNLADEIKQALSKREDWDATPVVDLERRASATPTATGSDNSIIVNLLESLKNSGLASSVVKSLITDSAFLKWGANLISELFSSGAITLPQLLSALKDSGLVPALIKQFLNFGTLKTVIVNALAAAFGNCGGSSLTTAKPSTTATPTSTPTTPGGGSNCKRRRRSYNY
jgi:hypothetical protein